MLRKNIGRVGRKQLENDKAGYLLWNEIAVSDGQHSHLFALKSETVLKFFYTFVSLHFIFYFFLLSNISFSYL